MILATARRLAVIALLTGALAGCAETPQPQSQYIRLAPAAFADLPGWNEDDQAASLAAFRRSCPELAKLSPDAPIGPGGGPARHWQNICANLPKASDAVGAREFFELAFSPYLVGGNDNSEGLFTGYYEPELAGSRTQNPAFRVPLYRRPPDLVTVDLREFRDDFTGTGVVGHVVDGRLKPYPTRADIDGGALAGQDLELLWLADPVDAFFLQIQGSGRIRLAGGGTTRVGFAAHNGHDFVSIGRILIEKGKLTKDQATAQGVAQWLKDHPSEAAGLMARNPRYIFFRDIEGEGPIGAQGVVLTAERSMAVDGSLWPLGAPFWIDTTWPAGTENAGRPLQRLMIAQDVGGAIKGAVRGDLFWGTGDEALAVAGRLRQPGRYYILLPKSLTPTTGFQLISHRLAIP